MAAADICLSLRAICSGDSLGSLRIIMCIWSLSVYPADEQRVLFAETFGCCRFVYNWALNLKITAYKERKETLGNVYLTNLMKSEPKAEHEWLSEISSQSLQSALRNPDTAYTAFISFPAMFGLALIANEFIVIAVTAKWQACVPIMQILCIWGAFVPITYMYSNLLISKGKSNLFMWNTIAQSLVQLTMLLCTISQGILVMAVIYTVINIGWLLIWHYFVNKQIHITLWEVMKDITPYLLISGGVIGTSYFLTIGFHNLYVLLILKIGIAVSLYVFIMWIGKSVIFFESVQFIRKKLLK